MLFSCIEMDGRIKKSVIKITKNSITSDKCLGDMLSDELFVDQAIYIDKEGRAFWLYSDESKKGVDGLIITELLAVLKDFEASHLLFVANKQIYDDILFFSNKTKCVRSQFEGLYDLGGGLQLQIQEENAVIKKNGNEILSGTILPDVVAKDVVRYFLSVVYPTEGLIHYVERGFQTEEQYQAKRANTISIASVFVAILIAVSSPFLTIWWSNTHGRSTIIESQYNRLLDSISVLDNNQRDTVIVSKVPKKELELKHTTIKNK